MPSCRCAFMYLLIDPSRGCCRRS